MDHRLGQEGTFPRLLWTSDRVEIFLKEQSEASDLGEV
jgi:hypothetical protein